MNPSGALSPHTASIFTIPCPDCGVELTPVAEVDYACPECGSSYRANLGYLVPTQPGTVP